MTLPSRRTLTVFQMAAAGAFALTGIVSLLAGEICLAVPFGGVASCLIVTAK
jgi:hypothetical protein